MKLVMLLKLIQGCYMIAVSHSVTTDVLPLCLTTGFNVGYVGLSHSTLMDTVHCLLASQVKAYFAVFSRILGCVTKLCSMQEVVVSDHWFSCRRFVMTVVH